MQMRKKFLMLLIALSCVAGIIFAGVGCRAKQTNIEYVLGVSLANLSEQWRLALKNELDVEASKHENIRLVYTDAANDSTKQIADVQRLMNCGVDLLIISPCDVEELTPVISEVYAEIPVIVLDRAVEGFSYSLFIGPDNQLIGQQAAQTVLQEAEGTSDGSVAVLELMTTGYASQKRSETFLGAMRRVNAETRPLLLGEATRDCAEDVLSNTPKLLENIDVIFAHNDYMAYGARLALQKLGYTDIKIVGLDGFSGEDGGVQLVQKGLIDSTVTCPTGGTEAIQSAMDILDDVSGVPKQIILRSHIINKQNVDAYVSRDFVDKTSSAARIRVGYVQIGDEGGWRRANTSSINEAARDFGIDLTLVETDQSIKKQIEQVRQFIQEEMDVIVISPVIESGWDAVLQEAQAAGIPVLLSDRKVQVSESLYTSFIGADFMEQGRQCANWLLQNTKDMEHVNILEIQGTENASPTLERNAGFAMRLKDDEHCKIAYSDYGDFNREGGKRVMQAYLEKNSWDIDAIYCHNDDMALGAIEVLTEYGIEPGKDVKIISIDGTCDALDALKMGQINCVAECNPLLGPQLMKAITDLMQGKELPLRIITDEIVFTAETPKEYFQNRKY